MDLNKKLEELKPYQLNCNVFDVYSYNGLTMQDLLCQFFTKINECITVSNETIDLAKWLVNEGLELEVVKKLMIWLEDGTLENIINVNIFNTLNEKINGLSSQLEHNTIINVKDFGDDFTEALHNALKYIKERQLNVNDFSSEDVNCINYCLRIPGGNYEYNGDGVSLNELANLKLIGDGYNATRIKINKDIHLLTASSAITYLEIGGIKFAGGKGVFNHTHTGANVRSGVYIHDNYFYGYTENAIGSMSIDYPYWTVENNVFYGTESSIGLAIPGGSDCTSIAKNKFLCNKFHIKLKGGTGCKIKNNDFIRFTSSFDMNDIWLVPYTGLTGKDLVISENKFGNENLTNNAKRILIASDEGVYTNNINYSTSNVGTVVQGAIIDRNSFSGGAYNSIIHSYTTNFRDNYFNFILNGTFPKYLVYFEGDCSTSDYTYRINNLIEISQSNELMTQKPPIISNIPIFKINDCFNYYDVYSRKINAKQDKNIDHVIDNSKTIKDIAQSLGGSYFENLENKYGFKNTAIKIKGYGFCFNMSLKRDTKANISFMAKSDEECNFTLIMYHKNSAIYKKFITATSDWNSYNIDYTPIEDISSVRVEISPCDNVIFSDLSVHNGSEKIINDISTNSCIDLQPLSIESTTENYGRLFFNGTDLNFILPNGVIKKIQLID